MSDGKVTREYALNQLVNTIARIDGISRETITEDTLVSGEALDEFVIGGVMTRAGIDWKPHSGLSWDAGVTTVGNVLDQLDLD